MHRQIKLSAFLVLLIFYGQRVLCLSTDADPLIFNSSKPFWDANIESPESGLSFLKEISDIESEQIPSLTGSKSDKILMDYKAKISSEFKIPDLIFNQTKFWFRVYTEFDSNKKIIHDALHPQIIFDIIDVSSILQRPTRAKWLNVQAADKFVYRRLSQIKVQLKKMLRKSKLQMSAEELGWMAQFDSIQGNKKRIIERAVESIRVQTGQKDFFQTALFNSGIYLPGIEEILQRRKLPVELGRLPFVESSFAIGATSKVGAAGIWQIMPGVGRKFLTINDIIDERRNPWKATDTAARLLKENHQILYKKWGLALTAYNHGPAGVRRAIQVTGSKDISQIVRKFRSPSFDFASANFYTCFLAALHAERYADLIWPNLQRAKPMSIETLILKKTIKTKNLLKVAGMNQDELVKFNPELDKAIKINANIPKGYKLFIPLESKKIYLNTFAVNE